MKELFSLESLTVGKITAEIFMIPCESHNAKQGIEFIIKLSRGSKKIGEWGYWKFKDAKDHFEILVITMTAFKEARS